MRAIASIHPKAMDAAANAANAKYCSTARWPMSFSAASNVTGILSETDRVAALLHRNGALSFWDYAAAAPYVPIRMSDSRPGAGGKDAIFLSPHKFPGGPKTPGSWSGGVTWCATRCRPHLRRHGRLRHQTGHRYLDDPTAREEGGTPAIVESIRAGLVFALKQAVGTDLIQAREERLWRHALRRWQDNPHLEILGNPHARPLPIVSFRIRHGTRYPHRTHAGEQALVGHLQQARTLLAARRTTSSKDRPAVRRLRGAALVPPATRLLDR